MISSGSREGTNAMRRVSMVLLTSAAPLVLVPVLAPVLAVLEGAVWPQPASSPTLRAPASRRERAFFMSNAS